MSARRRPIGPFPAGVEEDDYDRLRRRVLWLLPSGLYLLGACDQQECNFMTASLVSQVCVEPKLVGVAVEHEAFTARLIGESGVFTLSLLHKDDRLLVRKFVKPAEHDQKAHTLNEVAYRRGPVTGAPILERAAASLELSLRHRLELGSHHLFIGEVVNAQLGEPDQQAVLEMSDTRMSYGG